jgi:3'-5' exoribonuclease
MATAVTSNSGRSSSVATLRADEAVDGVFACTRKDRQLSRAGNAFLTLELRDSSGAIVARAFRDADVLAGRFERGDLVRVRGRVARFRDQLQLEVDSIARADGADPASFLPVAYRDLDELDGFMEHIAREVYEPALAQLLQSMLGDERLRAQFRCAPCAIPAPGAGLRRASAGAGAGGRSSGGHHAYLGGLLEHTVAVAQLALELCALHPRLDRDLLVCAALVHDVGRTREFTYGAEIGLSDEGRLLGHIELGLRAIAEHVPATLAAERRLALEHCVLLHHGPEPASGRRFGSAEALALYRCNALDAHVKGAFEHGLGAAL